MHKVNGVMKDKRPVYLNLFKIRLPIAGMVSLAHRASGILLFVAIPFAVYLLDLSIISPDGFNEVITILQHPVILLLEVILVWALAHHFFAGIRFLLIDADIGVDKVQANYGSWIVVIAELIVVGLFVCELVR
jgi:succinate dehydrogenase / fumarate reductase cytochrome b subunit